VGIYDVFISYALEDSQFAAELAGGLKSRGIRVWYAGFELKVGDNLLDSINRGLEGSKCSILLISSQYLKRGWTNYEMDVLIRQSIETKKQIFPVWHNITKEEVAVCQPGLANIVALKSDMGLHVIIRELTIKITKPASTLVIQPEYESPIFRFLKGCGELKKASDERAFTLWEAILYFRDDEYPIWVEGEIFNKEDLLYYAAQSLAVDNNTAKHWVGENGTEQIQKQCIGAGFNPNLFV